MGMFLFCKRDNQSDEGFNVSRKDYSRIKLQMRILIYGYALVSTLTLLWFISFPFIFKDKDIECPEEHYWLPSDEEAGALAFIKSILLISPTFVLWLTFFYFRIPRINNENIKFGQQGNEESSNTLSYVVAPGQLITANQANAYNKSDVSHLTNNNRRNTKFNSKTRATQSFSNDNPINENKIDVNSSQNDKIWQKSLLSMLVH